MHLPVLLPLSQVTSSKCEVDEDWFHQERVATEQDCRAFCDSWLPEPGCKFSAWIPDDPYTVFSSPNWVDFGIFLFFIIIVRLCFYRLYVTPTTYL